MLKKQFSKTKQTCKVTFTLPKKAIAEAIEVKILGDFNNWDWEQGVSMKATKNEFKAVIELPTGRNYQFRYLADNGIWENDWAADGYVPAPYNVDNSVVVLPATNGSATSKADTATAPKKAVAKKTRKKATTKDDLKKIEGIGPKIANLLNTAGIVTFTDLSKAPISTLKKVLTEAGSRFQMHDPSTWAAQAKLAAKSEWAKLKKWQEELKGGKQK